MSVLHSISAEAEQGAMEQETISRVKNQTWEKVKDTKQSVTHLTGSRNVTSFKERDVASSSDTEKEH